MTVQRARAVRVAVVGGGIAGLAAAHAIERMRRSGSSAATCMLFEASPRVGGNIRTETVDGFLIDAGPDGFVAAKPDAKRLCDEIGLGGDLVETLAENRRVYVVHDGRLESLPEGMVLAIPTQIGPFIGTPLLSWGTKFRAAIEPLRARPKTDEDESITSFLTRRLGAGFVDLFGEAVMAGIHAGDPDRLSIRATFPQLLALEKEHRSLVLGALASRRKRAASAPASSRAKPPSAFLSLRQGMQSLPDALASRLPRGSLRVSTAVRSMTAIGADRPHAWRLDGESASLGEFDHVVLAVPPSVAARLLAPHAPESGRILGEVDMVSTATVFLAFDRAAVAHPLDASGCVFPRSARRSISAATWVSSKYPGRAPEGAVLVRAFVGGARDRDLPLRDDAAITSAVLDELRPLLGVRAPPRWTRVYRYPNANPQMLVGHLDRLRRVRHELGHLGGLHVVGGGYDGVGMPDCIKFAESTIDAIVEVKPARP